jgi:hypothetical protein
MLFKEITGVYSDSDMKHTNTFYMQTAESVVRITTT